MPVGPAAADPGALELRARVHRALGDPHRLAIVDLLVAGDRTPGELADAVGLPSNLTAFHLGELEAAGVVARRRSEGDGRRRYVRLLADEVAGVPIGAGRGGDVPPVRVLFVCTANQARSPLAAALWTALTGSPAESAGTRPAQAPHPLVVSTARSLGLVLDPVGPRGLASVSEAPDLVVSVCDRAREDGLPFGVPTLHWSVPDPVPVGAAAVEAVVRELEARVRRLGALPPGSMSSDSGPQHRRAGQDARDRRGQRSDP